MAYSLELEKRIDAVCLRWLNLEKKAMFGGIGYLQNGNMAFGIWKESLVVRCGKGKHQMCLSEDQVSPFDITGRAMSGWVLVSSIGVDSQQKLKCWMQIGQEFASKLPPK